MKVNSLRFRLAAGAILWISAALAATGMVLGGLFSDYVERGFEHQLTLQLDRLSGGSEVDARGALWLKRLLVDPRFEQPYSGWYWQVGGPQGPILRSRSLWDQALAIGTLDESTSAPVRSAETGPEDQRLWVLRRTIDFPDSRNLFEFAVAADTAEMRAAIDRFTSTLAWSLAVLGSGLILAVVLQVSYGLFPLRRLRDGLVAVRSGRVTRLAGSFPDEVTPLVTELNGLLDHNEAVVERARTHVGNLAHALKTPLSVIANAAAKDGGPLAATVDHQVATMSGQIDHHLARARMVVATGVLGARTEVTPIAEELRRTLVRIHADRSLALTIEGADGLVFRGERQDLQEMLGNLMDNACKWGRSVVRVTLADGDRGLTLCVEDDGPGLAPEIRARVFDRGRRGDETVPGDGLGLAIVRDVTELYGGHVSLDDSPLGGLAATLHLPAGT